MSNINGGNQTDKNQILKDSEELFISDSRLYSYIHKKLERLVSATYKVTEFMDNNEPIRERLRTMGTDVLVYLSRTYAEGDKEKRNATRFVLNELSSMVSLCEVAILTTLVSEMNLRIIKEELISLINIIEGRWESSAYNQNLANLIEIPEQGLEYTNDYRNQNNELISYKRQQKDNVLKNDFNNVNTRQAISESNESGKVSNRQQKIVDFLRTNGESGIKEIAKVIKEFSEKTIQRDLGALVNSGVLKKEGERRWSKYSIV